MKPSTEPVGAPLPWRLDAQPSSEGLGVTFMYERVVDARGQEVCRTSHHAAQLGRGEYRLNGRSYDPASQDYFYETYYEGEPFPHSEAARLIVESVNAHGEVAA